MFIIFISLISTISLFILIVTAIISIILKLRKKHLSKTKYILIGSLITCIIGYTTFSILDSKGLVDQHLESRKENNLQENDTYNQYTERYNQESSSTDNDTEEYITNDYITTEQKKLIIATSQLSIDDYDLNDDTDHSIDSWTINKQDIDSKTKWIATTSSPKHKRIKLMFDWSGNDNESLTLIYLLVDGTEYLNNQ